jgi:hypothetical protein
MSPAPVKNDAYTGILVISFLAMAGACVLLYLDYENYSAKPPAVNLTAPTPTKGGLAPSSGTPAPAPETPMPKNEEPKVEEKKETSMKLPSPTAPIRNTSATMPIPTKLEIPAVPTTKSAPKLELPVVTEKKPEPKMELPALQLPEIPVNAPKPAGNKPAADPILELPALPLIK